ncbi:MAG: imidazole glycerol phosphate synthase subunit HisH [Elusimicrobiota bacterium]
MTAAARARSAKAGTRHGGSRRAGRTLVAGVVDYGMGNLRSVAKSLEAAGAEVVLADSARKLGAADLLVVPGVGAFRDAMSALRRASLDKFIRRWTAAGRPYLGICLGLQMLFDSSEEAPGARGLGILPGRVVKFRPRRRSLKVPHMGWNQVSWKRPVLKGNESSSFYFVHSYYPRPKDRSVVWGETDYDGRFCSAVASGNIFATQFHPEKSGDAGARFLREVLAAVPSPC